MLRHSALGLLAALGIGLAACSGGGAEPSEDAFCAAAKDLPEIEALLASLDAEDLEAATSALDELVAASPEEVRADVATVRNAARALADAVAASPDDPDAGVEAVLREQEADQRAITEAGKAVERYAMETCELDLTPSSTTSTTAPPGATDTITGLD